MTLLERLAAATGPDRELDVLIALDQRIVRGFDPTPFKADALGYEQDGEAGFIRVYLKASPETWLWRGAAPDYTGSIDTALSWRPTIDGRPMCVKLEVYSTGEGNCALRPFTEHPAQAYDRWVWSKVRPTMPLAICIAICKARGIG